MSMAVELPRNLGACGIYGVLRKKHARKIKAEETLASIECVRFRGSNLGAGFAAYNLPENSLTPYKLKAFIDGEDTLELIYRMLSDIHNEDIRIVKEIGFEDVEGSRFHSWSVLLEGDREKLTELVSSVNELLLRDGIKGRIYSWGRYVDVFKGVGYPLDVCNCFRLVEQGIEADLWLAHTRQPTNSPGVFPIWSHPFSSNEWAIAHNGDVSSFGANMEYLRYRGFTSFVGTDSEVMAFILDYLTRVKKLTLEQALVILANPYEEKLLSMNGVGSETLKLIMENRGASLDGPFSVVGGYCDGEDLYLIALTDRSKFRPIVVGEDEDRIYVASEEAEIRVLSEDAEVWTLKPGGYFIASLKKGIIVKGRDNDLVFFHNPCRHEPPSNALDAEGMDYHTLNIKLKELASKGFREIYVKNVKGQRYLGVGLPTGTRLHIYGTPGNCLANFNMGVEIYVYGNAEDDVGDTMHGGRVVIHGDARDVIAQALQGGEILVRGNVGNRAAIQMREYGDKKPFLIVGGRADDYFGEYMAGGVAAILGLATLESNEEPELVGNYVASGMVGGRIYIRGKVSPRRIGYNPPRLDVIRYLKGLLKEKIIDPTTYQSLLDENDLTYNTIKKYLNEKALRRINKLFINKYFHPPTVQYRKLDDEDLNLLLPALRRFFNEFHLPDKLLETLLEQKFTVITAGKQGKGAG